MSDDQDPDPSIDEAKDEVSSEFNEPADALLVVRDISQVFEDLRTKRPSLYASGSDMAELSAYYMGAKGQRWIVEGVAPEDSVATVPDDLKFMMYSVVIRKMKILPPFTAF